MDRRIEDKVQFGSDSDQDIVQYVVSKYKGRLGYTKQELADDSYESEEEIDENPFEFEKTPS